jgi:hypothetical protein
MRWLLVLVAACGSAVSPASARYDRCDQIKVTAAPDEADVVKAVVVQRCTQDAWECAPGDDLDVCKIKLGDDQKKKLAAELDVVLAGLAVGKLADFERQMCACKTGNKACAARVKTAWVDYERVHPPQSGDRHRGEILKAAQKCEALAMREDPMAAMRRFKDEMCGCADAECAKKVSDEMTTWAQEHFKDGDYEKMSEDDMKAATEIGMAMANCMSKAMGAGGTP